MNTPTKLVPLGLLARRLRVPVRWLREEALAGRVPHLKADKALLFDPEAVERSLLERARQGGGDHAILTSSPSSAPAGPGGPITPAPGAPSPLEPLLVDAVEAARLLGISARTLWQLTKDGKIRCKRFGRAVRYSVEVLRAFANSDGAAGR